MAKKVPYLLPQDKQQYNISDFSGGINSVDADSLLKDNQVRDLINFRVDKTGNILKRAGQTVVDNIIFDASNESFVFDTTSNTPLSGFTGSGCTFTGSANGCTITGKGSYTKTYPNINIGKPILSILNIKWVSWSINSEIQQIIRVANIKYTLSLKQVYTNDRFTRVALIGTNGSNIIVDVPYIQDSAINVSIDLSAGFNSTANTHQFKCIINNTTYDITLNGSVFKDNTNTNIITYSTINSITEFANVIILKSQIDTIKTDTLYLKKVNIGNKTPYLHIFSSIEPITTSGVYGQYTNTVKFNLSEAITDNNTFTKVSYANTVFTPTGVSTYNLVNNQCDGFVVSNDFTLSFDCVPYGGMLYLTTGFMLLVCSYESSTYKISAYKDTIYTPNTTEIINLGYNILLKDPETLNNGTVTGTTTLEGLVIKQTVNSITKTINLGQVNKEITLYAPFTKANSGVSATFAFSYTYRSTFTDTPSETYTSITNSNNDYTTVFTPNRTGFYNFKIVMNPDDSATDQEFYYNDFEVKNTNDFDKIETSEDLQNKLFKSTGVIVYYDQLVYFGGSDTIFFSRPFKPNYIPHTHFVSCKTPQNDNVIGCVIYQNTLTYFTNNTIGYLAGGTFNSNDFRKVSVNEAFGCVSQKSIKQIGNYVYFQSRYGIAILKTLYGGDLRLNVDLIDGNIRDDDFITLINTYKGTANWTTNSYKLYFVKSITETITWCYDYSLNIWYKEVYPFAIIDGLNFLGSEFFGGKNTEKVKYLTNGGLLDFSTTPITSTVKTGRIDFALPYHQKKFKELFITHTVDNNPASYYLTVTVDNSDIIGITKTARVITQQDGTLTYVVDEVDNRLTNVSAGIEFTFLWDSVFGEVDNPKKTIKVTGRGYAIQLEITHNLEEVFGLQDVGVVCKFKQKPKIK